MRSVMLQLEQVDKTFSGRQPLHVLQQISFAVQHGEFVAILGPSGCGKTTLLRMITGLEQPSSGRILHSGQEVRSPDLTRGYVFQEPRLYPWLTVAQNIAFAQGDGEVERLVDNLELTGFLHAYPRQLSGGMAKRVALARALYSNPDLILLDEPLANLDVPTKKRMEEYLLRIWNKSLTCIMVTHDIEEVLSLATRLIILSARPGKIIKDVAIKRPIVDYQGWREKILAWSMEADCNEE